VLLQLVRSALKSPGTALPSASVSVTSSSRPSRTSTVAVLVGEASVPSSAGA
jgi:hypothetical protein